MVVAAVGVEGREGRLQIHCCDSLVRLPEGTQELKQACGPLPGNRFALDHQIQPAQHQGGAREGLNPAQGRFRFPR
jgi:hypothetical protein